MLVKFWFLQNGITHLSNTHVVNSISTRTEVMTKTYTPPNTLLLICYSSCFNNTTLTLASHELVQKYISYNKNREMTSQALDVSTGSASKFCINRKIVYMHQANDSLNNNTKSPVIHASSHLIQVNSNFLIL